MERQTSVFILAALLLIAMPARGDGPSAPEERFVPAAGMLAGGRLEVRGEARIIGEEVRLRQICRWSAHDEAVFGPIGGLVIMRLPSERPMGSVSTDQIRQTLHAAGVNTAMIRFAGALSCTVTRTDVAFDEASALQQWYHARNAESPLPTATSAPEASEGPRTLEVAVESDDYAVPEVPRVLDRHAASALPPQARPVIEELPVSDSAPVGVAAATTLRDLLQRDLSERLNLPVEVLQVDFNPRDQSLLNLPESQFTFHITPRRLRDLGSVVWSIEVMAGDRTDRFEIEARARAWQEEVVAAQPLAFRQVIRPEDLATRRVLVDQLAGDLLLTPDQVVGQQASRALRVGTVMTARMIESAPLVRTGQFVTISITQGNIQVRTVARALDSGAFGEIIRVRNEATRDIYEVVVTGPQTGEVNPAPRRGGGTEVAERW